MSEKNANDRFRDKVRRLGDRFDRIENLVGLGFPDTNCCFQGVEFWMETKAPTEPKRDSTALFGSNHKLTIEQRNWFLRQRRAGGAGYIYIDTDKRRMLIDGKHADVINTSTVGELVTLSLWVARRPTKKEEWEDLRKILISNG